MIIIKINILYVIQIRHTDDFPSTGTRLVLLNDVKLFQMLVKMANVSRMLVAMVGTYLAVSGESSVLCVSMSLPYDQNEYQTINSQLFCNSLAIAATRTSNKA